MFWLVGGVYVVSAAPAGSSRGGAAGESRAVNCESRQLWLVWGAYAIPGNDKHVQGVAKHWH
jgi:hypothetical protein